MSALDKWLDPESDESISDAEFKRAIERINERRIEQEEDRRAWLKQPVETAGDEP